MNIFLILLIILLFILLLWWLSLIISSTNQSAKINLSPLLKQGQQEHKAKSLVLSCMDYRFISQTVDYLNGTTGYNNYDYFVLAGASLGYNESRETTSTPEIPKDGIDDRWYLTYQDHVRLAIQLHGITALTVVDHMDCGYYKSVYGDAVNSPEKEERKHNFNLYKFARYMKKSEEFKHLEIILLLAYIDDKGQVAFKPINEE